MQLLNDLSTRAAKSLAGIKNYHNDCGEHKVEQSEIAPLFMNSSTVEHK